MLTQVYRNPEPVPLVSQLAVLPFLSGVDGLLRENGEVAGLRITVHRVMSREGQGYLQQVCAYINDSGADWRGKVGRTFPVTEGIIGAAYETGRVWRTKSFPTREALIPVMHEDMKRVGDQRDPNAVAIAYLAIPMLGPEDEVVLILYADCNRLNFFVDDQLIRHVVAMCKGFCRLFDCLQYDPPFPNLRNLPLEKGKPAREKETLYPSIQECVEKIDPPKFKAVPFFNYEAAAA
jgi:hypothetical protein